MLSRRLLWNTLAAGCLAAGVAWGGEGAPAKPDARQGPKVFQPVQEYFLSFEENERADGGMKVDLNPFRFYTHIGTDYGRMGSKGGEPKITWQPGRVNVVLRHGLGAAGWEWAGMWHSLAGLAREKEQFLDFQRCYPFLVRDEFQPRCVGIFVRAKGSGPLKLEIKSADEQLIWEQRLELSAGDQTREFVFDCSPATLRRAKLLNWVTERNANLSIDTLGLVIQFPPMPFEKRVLLISYAKLARGYSRADGVVRDRANFPAGDFDSVPTSGLFCLATAAAWRAGLVDQSVAEETLRGVHRAVSGLPRAHGLLPHFIRKYDGTYRIHHGTEYSTVDTSLYYHGMLLAAQMLSDNGLVAELAKAVREIRFDALRVADGWVIHGLKDDGRTRLASTWRDWGGETALVLLLERMAAGRAAPLRMDPSGRVFGGVGFIAEIQSLFYPQFSLDVPDALTGVNWLKVRRELLKAQMSYLPPTSPAAQLGLFGFSAGEGFRGVGYVANGTETTPRTNLVHPHYLLMSALLRPRLEETYHVLGLMEARGLLPPWGMVENVTADLTEYLPLLGSLNASFEALSAYHLWAKAAGEPDRIYEAAQACPILHDAIEAFYPRRP